MHRGVQGTEDVVTLTSVGRAGSAPVQNELLRVPNLNCCAAPWGGMRLKADNRGGAYLVWMKRMASPPYRRLHVRHAQARLPGQCFDGAFTLREEVDELDPLRAPEGRGDLGEALENGVLEFAAPEVLLEHSIE